MNDLTDRTRNISRTNGLLTLTDGQLKFWLVFLVTHQLSYLYSLTKDDKEERAEDEGADDEGADD